MEHGSSKQNVGFILQSIRAFCTEKEVITMYSKEAFIRDCVAIFAKTEGNTVEIPGVGSIVLFDEPLIGFADAEDALFESYRQPEIIETNFMSPKEWLPAAGTVVSFFLPFTEAVRRSNRADRTDPSPEWLYGRIEGQAFISRFTAGLKKMLKERRTECCVPSLDDRFGIRFEAAFTGEKPDFHADSRWSERHAAYACGLGTFSLSRGLISEKRIAGRYASLIVSETWPPQYAITRVWTITASNAAPAPETAPHRPLQWNTAKTTSSARRKLTGCRRSTPPDTVAASVRSTCPVNSGFRAKGLALNAQAKRPEPARIEKPLYNGPFPIYAENSSENRVNRSVSAE